jgi:hypothetical protein
MTTNRSREVDTRAIVLFILIMAAAGNFIADLRWNKQPTWEGSRQYLRETNLDVLTAEAIVWVTFLMGQLWMADQEEDHEMFERVGYVTVSTAGRLGLDLIEKETGFDFKARAVESRKLYLQTIKDHKLVEAFA